MYDRQNSTSVLRFFNIAQNHRAKKTKATIIESDDNEDGGTLSSMNI